METVALAALGCRLVIRCADPRTRALVADVYGALAARAGGGRQAAAALLTLGDTPVPDALLGLDREIVVALQRRRPDLYFVHGAVLARAGRAVLLVAPSGTGKSTMAWALAARGYRYLSDELAPVDVRRRLVHPFPRALCLKTEPPGAGPLPAGTLRTARALYVPAGGLPGGVGRAPAPVAAIVFLHRPAGARAPAVRRLGPAAAAARLLANALNPLAHPGAGLDAALALARRAPCFALLVGEPAATCRRLEATLAALDARSARRPAPATCGSPS